MKWVTRERPTIDRLACPWLICRFIDRDAEIHYVPAAQVLAIAASEGAIPFEVPGVELTHSGPLCSFDALERSAQAPGLLAISLGLGANITDDQELLKTALPVYDAPYTWCSILGGERHGWHSRTAAKEMGR